MVRASFARGWTAQVDGGRAPVRRANGKHRAVAVPAGRHEVVFSYAPPWLSAGVFATATGLLACLALLLRPGSEVAS